MFDTIIEKITDEVIALTVVIATMGSYYCGVEVPNEALLVVLGYYFAKKM